MQPNVIVNAAAYTAVDKAEAPEGRVTACYFGDGAVAEGAFHESLNLAQLWRLPVAWFLEIEFPTMHDKSLQNLITTGIGVNDTFKNAERKA